MRYGWRAREPGVGWMNRDGEEGVELLKQPINGVK